MRYRYMYLPQSEFAPARHRGPRGNSPGRAHSSAMSALPTTCYRMPGFRNTLHHGRTRRGRFPSPLGISTIHQKNRQASIRRCASAARHSNEVLLPNRVFGRGLDTVHTGVANERDPRTPARGCDPISVGTGPATMPATTIRPFGANRSVNAGGWAPATPSMPTSKVVSADYEPTETHGAVSARPSKRPACSALAIRASSTHL